MKSINLNIFLVVSIVFTVAHTVPKSQSKIPAYLKICHRKDPNLNECVKESIETLRPQLATGIKELLLPSCEPLQIPQIAIKQNSGAISMESLYSNVLVYGLTNFTLNGVRLDLEKKLLSFDLVIPRLRIDATYNLKGNILLLPLVGSGNVAMTMKDVKSSVYTKISIKKKPEDVIHIEEMKVTFLVGGMRIHLSNLFNGNKVLGSSLNMFLNQNANEVISELRPDLEKGLADIFTGLWNNVFSKLPIDLWLK
ncbi:hypothetical protein HA402_010796 [Bradysia odoriphaga]|nr:hypothetical protein HA402_010796 [Bradysia odoriphaga]